MEAYRFAPARPWLVSSNVDSNDASLYQKKPPACARGFLLAVILQLATLVSHIEPEVDTIEEDLILATFEQAQVGQVPTDRL